MRFYDWSVLDGLKLYPKRGQFRSQTIKFAGSDARQWHVSEARPAGTLVAGEVGVLIGNLAFEIAKLTDLQIARMSIRRVRDAETSRP
jgi:hypothetical protein